jgi:uncharacterized protein GlcG (DUF336 family)
MCIRLINKPMCKAGDQSQKGEGPIQCQARHGGPRTYYQSVTSNPTAAGALHLANITTLERALPIMAGQELVGAIGGSGAPGGDKDAVCAQAGIDRIAKGLGS